MKQQESMNFANSMEALILVSLAEIMSRKMFDHRGKPGGAGRPFHPSIRLRMQVSNPES